MARRRMPPVEVTVWYRGLPYTLDLVRCRRALVERQVEGGLDTMESLAQAVGISRSTASRYFAGRQTSLTVTLRILEVLGLTFNDVARLDPDDGGGDDTEGPSGVGARSRPQPRPPESGTAVELEERVTSEAATAGR
jgi:transcriptional regulator with XRE-family HTH domain